MGVLEETLMGFNEGKRTRRYWLTSPGGSEIIQEGQLQSSNWEEMKDAKAWRREWKRQEDAIGPVTDKRWVVSGVLLPIWGRLGAEGGRVRRLECDGGERVVGRSSTGTSLRNSAKRCATTAIANA